MVASSIPCKLSLCADRVHARAGDSHASSGIDVACPTSQSVFAIASPHELHGDFWPSSSTGTRSFCCNHQYSVTAVTTSTGAIAERYAYSAYGQPTILDASASVLSSSAISNRYTYTGREWDATLGLHHFRARWMSPIAGRFLGRDPIGYEDGMSLYRSQLGLRFLDPNGLQCIEGWRGEACFNFTKFKVKGTLFGDVTPPFLGSWKDKWWIMQSGYFKGTLDASIDFKDVFHCCGCDNEADIPVAIRVNMHIDIDYIELNTRLGYIWTVTRSLFFPYWFNALYYTGPFIKDAHEAINRALERLDGFEKGAKKGLNNICDAWRKNGESLPSINLVINLSYANYTYGTPPSSNTREGLFPTVDIDLGSGIPSDCLNKKSFEPGCNPSFGGS